MKKHPVRPLDLIILAALFLLVGYLGYRLFYSLNYKWNWSVIGTYLVRIDPETGNWRANILLEGLFTTIKLSCWAAMAAIVIGFVVGLMRVSPRLFFRLSARTYIELIRNIPPLVLVFIFYFFVSDQLLALFGVEEFLRSLSPQVHTVMAVFFAKPELIIPFCSGALTLALFQGAYFAEIVRAGVQAIDSGQWEAGQALGLSRWKIIRLIIFPQALRIMMPPLANEFINTIKWSSIVSIISIQELTFQGMQVMASTQAAIEIWITISAMYLLLCLCLSLIVRRIEKRFNTAQGVRPCGVS